MHSICGKSQHLLFLFHKGLKNLLNLKFYKMKIELCVHASQTLTASALITDVQSCNLIFLNADCFDHSVAILCGAFPALYRRLTVTGICNTALHFPQQPSLADLSTSNAAGLPKGSPPAFFTQEDTGLKVCSKQHSDSRKEFRSHPAAPSSSHPQPLS